MPRRALGAFNGLSVSYVGSVTLEDIGGAMGQPVQKEFRSPVRYRIMAATALGFILLSGPSEAQQCTSTANGSDMSVGHSARYQAATTQQSCSGRTTEVQAWIDGLVWDCSGEQTPNSNCIATNGGGNAVTTANDTG